MGGKDKIRSDMDGIYDCGVVCFQPILLLKLQLAMHLFNFMGSWASH